MTGGRIMNGKDYTLFRLHELLKEHEDRGNNLLVFKGFPGYFYEELRKTTKGLGDISYMNNKNYIDVNLLENSINELVINLISTKGIIWAFYEEFTSLTNSLTNINDIYKGNIYIYSNNIFDKYYPLEIDNKYLEKYIEFEDKDSLTEDNKIEIMSKYYGGCTLIDADNYGVSFVNKHSDEKIEVTPFFIDSMEIPIKGVTESDYLKVTAKESDIFNIKIKTLNGEFDEDLEITIDNDDEIISVKSLVTIFDHIGINCHITKNKRFELMVNTDSSSLIEILRVHWKSSNFRDIQFYKNPELSNETITINQGDIIADIIDQCNISLTSNESYRDIFITAPTGAGKSLLFQLPAIKIMNEYKAITLVITPLIALMRDQVDQLINERKIEGVAFINSDLTPDERDKKIEGIKRGDISIVYLSPELLLANSIESLIGDRKIGLLVVDEAHLVTTWGRDFRADYWFLGNYVERFRKKVRFPTLCLTATAVYMGTEDMVNDIISSMNLINPRTYLGNVTRKNINFDIRYIQRKDIVGGFEDFKVNKTKEALDSLIDKDLKTICYCPYTSQVEDIYNGMEDENKNKIGRYYGSLNKYEKNDSQENFKTGKYNTMICTKAFGMGIDISDIEAVYHFAPTGNLADYVQEIGRIARNPEITGVAISDYTNSDLKYVRMLYGLSGIRQYQLKEMIRKLYSLYLIKGNRNMLISPEVFSYMFNDKEIQNKVKSGLLLISKDLETKYTYNVLNVRPKSMFTKNFVNVPKEVEKEFLNRYGDFASPMYDDSSRILPSVNRWESDTILYNLGQVYEVNMAELWEKYFESLTFAQFKKEFFNGELFKFNKDEQLSPRLKLTISYNNNFQATIPDFNIKIEKLIKIFSQLKMKCQFFTKNEFKDIFLEKFKDDISNKELPNLILDLFVADVSIDPFFYNNNNNKFKFIQQRKAQDKDESVYRIMSNNFHSLPKYLSRMMQQCKPKLNENNYSAYIPVSKDGSKPELMYLSILLELFNFASYEVIGGRNTEIFIRINDPTKLRKLSNSNYSNVILTDIERKRKKSQEILSKFMTKDLSTEDRWDVIENYFLGREDIVDMILESKVVEVAL